jgi:hypothetical protein
MQEEPSERDETSLENGRETEGSAAEPEPRYPFDLNEDPPALGEEARALAERIELALDGGVLKLEQHILRPLAALAEVDAVCRSLEHGRPAPGTDDRRSLAADLQLAFTTLGDAARAVLQPAYREVVNNLVVHLPDLLDDPGGRLHTAGLVRELRRRLVSEDGLIALWRDVRAAANAGLHDEEVGLAVSRLIEAVEARGFEWRWLRMHILQYVRRGLFDEVEAELRRPVARSANVAWFAFGYADLPGGYLRVGQVQFFSSRLWPEAVRDREFIARIPEAEFPEELTDHAVERELKIDPDMAPPKLVYARVELKGPGAAGGKNPWAHGQPPYIWAREYVESLVQAATFRQGGSTWRLLDGGAVHNDGGGWSGTWPIHDPERFAPERDARDPLREGTGEALEELPKGFAERLAEGAMDAGGAAREVRWHLAVGRQDDPAQRIALFVRGFELALPIIGDERWHGAVKRYFRDFWALHRIGDEVMRLALDAERTFNWTGQHDVLKELPQFTDHHGGRVTVHLETFVDAAPALVDRFPEAQPDVKRRLRRLVKWAADAKLALEEIHRKQQQFDILLRRAIRQRNAVVHGIETVPAVVATAEPFVARLAATVVATAVGEASSGSPIHEALERGRVIEGRRLWRLENEAASVAAILFG